MFDRLMTMIRANLDQMLSKAEDPQKVLDLTILDMQRALVDAKKQVAVVIADERRLHRQAQAAAGMAAQWEQNAMLAVRSGADELARAALVRKKEHDELAEMYGEQWSSQKNSADALRSALVGLSQKIAEAHRTRRMLVARMRRAEAQRTINATLAGLSTSGHEGALHRMEQRVSQIEAEAESTLELTEGFEPSLEAQFRALEAGSVDDDLAALKQRMALQGHVPKALASA
jgi:phage shock protein A